MPINKNNATNKKNDAVDLDKENEFNNLSDPKYTFKDLIISDEIKSRISELILYEKNKKLIYETWGLGEVIKRINLSINLYGDSGTGKTMCANAIAYELNKKLITVNYADIESKYVGETSKNLQKMFSYAEKNDAIILFDEADALLSKRVTAMNSATDVSVNQTRNTLLKILDDYKGIVIYTTNFIENFDSAFLRRIFAHIKFDLPNRDLRKKLWKHYLTEKLPIENREITIDSISDIEDLTGADISNIVLKVAIWASNKENRVIKCEDIKKYIYEILDVKRICKKGYVYETKKVNKEYVLQRLKEGNFADGYNR